MSDYSAIELPEAAIPVPVATSFLAQVRAFVTGALVAAAVVAAGAVLTTVVLVVAVVGSPLLVVVLAYVVIRGGRMERFRAWRTLRAT